MKEYINDKREKVSQFIEENGERLSSRKFIVAVIALIGLLYITIVAVHQKLNDVAVVGLTGIIAIIQSFNAYNVKSKEHEHVANNRQEQ